MKAADVAARIAVALAFVLAFGLAGAFACRVISLEDAATVQKGPR